MKKKTSSWFAFDKWLFVFTILLAFCGVAFVYSANYSTEAIENPLRAVDIKQVFFLFFGLVWMWIVSVINYKKIAEHSNLLFVGCVLLLLYTLFFGKVVNHSKRWISLGPLTFQASEFVKIVMIVVIANYLNRYRDKMERLPHILGLFGIVLAPVFLIFLQPDLGTAIVFVPVTMVMLFVGGVSSKHFSAIILVGSLAAVIPLLLTYIDKMEGERSFFMEILGNTDYMFFLAIFFLLVSAALFIINLSLQNLVFENLIYFFFATFLGLLAALIVETRLLRQYQKERLLAFINPYSDPWDLGYNVIQSQITVGSGGWLGKGFLQGTQSQLGFLPARSTDFIFSVIGEEGGFIISGLIVILFYFFIARLIKIAREVKDYLGGLIVVGITTMFTVQIFINIGMSIGIAPVTGLPLPFLTSGGSTLWASLIAVGLIFNIELNKYVH